MALFAYQWLGRGVTGIVLVRWTGLDKTSMLGDPRAFPMARNNEEPPVNDRSTPRRRTAGEATALLIALDGLFSPVVVDVMDVSAGGVGILLPQHLTLAVGAQVALQLPV